MPVFKR